MINQQVTEEMKSLEQPKDLVVFKSEPLEGHIRNGQIRYCCLQGGNGNLKKTRPCIVVQGDEYNADKNSRIYVVPLSSYVGNIANCNEKFALMMNYESRDSKLSYVCLDRAIFVDRADIGAYIGVAPKELMVSICEFLFARLIKHMMAQ